MWTPIKHYFGRVICFQHYQKVKRDDDAKETRLQPKHLHLGELEISSTNILFLERGRALPGSDGIEIAATAVGPIIKKVDARPLRKRGKSNLRLPREGARKQANAFPEQKRGRSTSKNELAAMQAGTAAQASGGHLPPFILSNPKQAALMASLHFSPRGKRDR